MKDNFSKQADVYAKYRPSYPAKLFDFIVNNTKQKDTAWDCATGNGQSAKELSPHFKKIFATDISQKQISNAYEADNIFYSVQPAEQTTLDDHSIDLVTVAQALHWFNFERFYAEVKRVSKPGSWLSVWMYSLLRISPAIDSIIEKYHFETMKNYWDNERKYVDANYATVPFPFSEIKSPEFASEYHWTLEELEGYFTTWSALQKFIAANDHNPVPELIKMIEPHWNNIKMRVIFPIHMRMAPVH
jgi:ubiquinone/menaquinone biosynthesis C-methylase UbiE